MTIDPKEQEDRYFPPKEDLEFLHKQDDDYCKTLIKEPGYGSFVEGKVKVKGKVICLLKKEDQDLEQFPQEKEDVAYHLAIVLGDEDNLAWYIKLSRERRVDFLKNCLRSTMKASHEGKIKQTNASYFAGVVKNKTFQQELLNAYKSKFPEKYGGKY